MSISVLPPQYRDIAEHFVRVARGLAEAGQPLESILFVGRLGSKEAVPIQMNASVVESKEAAAHHARLVAASMNADYCLMVGEAWSLSPADLPRVDAILARYESLSQYPGRIEVASFNLETRYGWFAGSAQLVPKRPSKKKRTFGEVRWVAATHAEGRMTGVIPQDVDAGRDGPGGVH